jgi:hypothetical protein
MKNKIKIILIIMMMAAPLHVSGSMSASASSSASAAVSSMASALVAEHAKISREVQQGSHSLKISGNMTDVEVSEFGDDSVGNTAKKAEAETSEHLSLQASSSASSASGSVSRSSGKRARKPSKKKCAGCLYSSDRASGLEAHCKTHLGVLTDHYKIRCKCGLYFALKAEFDKHSKKYCKQNTNALLLYSINGAEYSSNEELTCALCKIPFFRDEDLREHLEMHKKSKDAQLASATSSASASSSASGPNKDESHSSLDTLAAVAMSSASASSSGASALDLLASVRADETPKMSQSHTPKVSKRKNVTEDGNTNDSDNERQTAVTAAKKRKVEAEASAKPQSLASGLLKAAVEHGASASSSAASATAGHFSDDEDIYS